MSITAIAILLFLFLVLPLKSAQTHRSGVLLSAPRSAIYVSVVVSQWLVVLLVVGAIEVERLEARWRGIVLSTGSLKGMLAWPGLTVVGPWLVFLLVTSAIVYYLSGLLRRWLGQSESETVYHLMPRTVRERWMFGVLVAPTAGFVEEILYRGIAITRLMAWVGGEWQAAFLSAAAFALGHIYQGYLGAARAGSLGFVLAIPFLYTGSLVPSILAHAAIDVLAGVFLRRWLLDEPGSSTSREQA